MYNLLKKSIFLLKNPPLNLNNLLIFIILVYNIFSTKNIYAQDIHYTQFYSSPLVLNPANTGNFQGDWRIAGNYRNQWRGLAYPFNTFSASFDKQFFLYNERISGGVIIMNDESGSVGLDVKKIYTSVAYNKLIKNNDLNVGIQFGYVFKTIDYDKLTFPSQFNMSSGLFDSELQNDEDNVGERLSYFDINLGISWKRKIKYLEPEIGFAMFHVNYPNESFIDKSTHLPFRYIFHVKTNISINEVMYFEPKFLYMKQKKSEDFFLGTDVGLEFKGRGFGVRRVFAGIYLRDEFINNSEALSVVVGIDLNRLELGFSYDFDISHLKEATSYKGAFEISFIYKSISTVLNSYSIPCERL